VFRPARRGASSCRSTARSGTGVSRSVCRSVSPRPLSGRSRAALRMMPFRPDRQAPCRQGPATRRGCRSLLHPSRIGIGAERPLRKLIFSTVLRGGIDDRRFGLLVTEAGNNARNLARPRRIEEDRQTSDTRWPLRDTAKRNPQRNGSR